MHVPIRPCVLNIWACCTFRFRLKPENRGERKIKSFLFSFYCLDGQKIVWKWMLEGKWERKCITKMRILFSLENRMENENPSKFVYVETTFVFIFIPSFFPHIFHDFYTQPRILIFPLLFPHIFIFPYIFTFPPIFRVSNGVLIKRYTISGCIISYTFSNCWFHFIPSLVSLVYSALCASILIHTNLWIYILVLESIFLFLSSSLFETWCRMMQSSLKASLDFLRMC